MKWYRRGNAFLAVVVIVLGIVAVITRPERVPADAEMRRWHLAAEGLQYLDDSGKPVRNQWEDIYGAEHYFDNRGILALGGWRDVMGERYYLKQNGQKTTGWLQLGEERFYLDESGKMVTGWNNVEEKVYYMNREGVMQRGWIELNGDKFLLSEDGERQTGWIDTPEGRRYLDADGRMHIGWVDTEEGRKFLDAEGVMQTGWIDTEEGRYYLNGDGVMQSGGWIDTEEGRYYLEDSGIVHRGWLDFQGNSYYLDENGKMVTGIQRIEESDYYFDDAGKRQTGWLKLDSVTYYFDKDGKRHTGWLDADGKRYFMDKNGIMRTGWITMEGKAHYFDKDGVYQPDVQPAATIEKTGPMVALTFDDGPGKYTDRLLSCLEENHVKATFFMLGSNVPRYPEAVKRMQELGCEIGNHTTNHKKLTSLTPEEVRSEIEQTNQNLTNIIGTGATLMRPPYGAYDDMVKQNSSLPLILWSIDTLDWKTLNAQSTVDTILDSVKDGDIILMHDIHSTSVDAAEIVIPELIKRGYQLVTVSELAAAKGKTLSAGTGYGSIRP